MSLIVLGTYAIFIMIAVALLVIGLQTKKTVLSLLSAAFLLRMFVIVFLETGIKYSFVIDSMKYEQDAWFIAKAWMNNQPDITLANSNFNLYTQLSALFFFLFGHSPLILTLFNVLIGVCTTYILFLIFQELSPKYSNLKQENKTHIILILLISFYPSFAVWTTTNTKDPLTILAICLGFFSTFKILGQDRALSKKALYGFLALGSFYMAYLLRGYALQLLAGGLILGLLLHALSQRVKLKTALFTISIILGTSLALFNLTGSELLNESLRGLFDIRLSFSNAGLDDAAQSSFLIKYEFHSIQDVLFFLPQAIGYYFFGPFPWQIANARQAVSLIEPLVFIFLIPSMFRGIKASYQSNKKPTLVLLSSIFILVVGQSMIISNLGTIFRHRTIVFLVLLCFAAIGFYEKKAQSR